MVDRLIGWLPRSVVLVDGECPLCRRSAGILHSLDWCDRLAFADASKDAERRRLAPSLERDTVLQEMYVLGPGGRLSGRYDGYLH